MKAVVKRILQRSNLELRKYDAGLPFVHEIVLGGLRFPFWIANRHAKSWWYKPYLEFRAEYQFIKKCCASNMVGMDIGAHHGIQTIPMAYWGGAGSRIFAFEANRENALVLSANLGLNQLSQCEAVCAAVGDRNGSLRFKNETISLDDVTAGEVESWSLDEFCKQRKVDKVDFIKIDVEGYEEHVLKGAQNILKFGPHINLELHLDDLPEYGSEKYEVLSYFDWDRYTVTFMDRARSWFDQVPVSSPSDVPSKGVVNLFFLNPAKIE